MSKFVSSVSRIVVKECFTDIHINDIDIFCLIVHDQLIEEEKFNEKSRKEKRAKTDDGDFSYLMSERHGRSKFCQSFSGQGSSNTSLKFNKDMVSNRNPQGGMVVDLHCLLAPSVEESMKINV